MTDNIHNYDRVVIEWTQEYGEYIVKGFDDKQDTKAAFLEGVDLLRIDGDVFTVKEKLTFPNGIKFEYFWHVDRAEIDIMI